MTYQRTARTAPVIDPGLPAEAQRHLLRKIDRSAKDRADAVGCFGLVAAVVWVFVSVIVHFATGLSWWWVGGSAVVAVGGFSAFAVSAHYTLDGHERDQFVESSHLDDSCRQLLLRAQRAIGTILSSSVYSEDSLDQTVGEADLRRHEWEIATNLRQITERSAELRSNTAGDAPGPMTAAVLNAHRHAIALAKEGTTSRVTALERYATQLQAADAAKRDWLRALKVAGFNDRYLDLVARTAADEKATAEITGLTQQTAAEVAFRASLHQATLAAEALILPPLRQNRPARD